MILLLFCIPYMNYTPLFDLVAKEIFNGDTLLLHIYD